MKTPRATLGLLVVGSATALAEPRATLQMEGGLQIAPEQDSEGISGYVPAPMFVAEAGVRVVYGVAVVVSWGFVTIVDTHSGGLSNPYVGVRRRFGSSWTIEIEFGTTLPIHDLEYGDRCVEGLNDPPRSLVYSGCRNSEREGTYSGMYRAALGRGYRDPWLWAIDWNNSVAQLRAIGDTELGAVEVGTFGVVAYDRNSESRIGLLGVSGELRPRCHGFGFTAAHVFGDESLTQFAGHVRWLRQDGPTTYEVRLDVPVPEPEHTAVSFGFARTF